jgi:N-acetylmuramoyl-L-alanine amidase
MISGTVVIDPGHGGTLEVGGSSANNATSPSGVLEKNMTLRMGLLVRDVLRQLAAGGQHNINVVVTRETDKNLGLADRARMAVAHNADLFLSIHFNASEQHNARGVETLVSPKDRNSNHAADVAFAQRIQNAVFNAIKAHDPATRDRHVKDQPLSVLNEKNLGKKARGCLLEVEFIDVPAVDQLLNLNANAPDVRKDIATAIALAMLKELEGS